MSEHTASVLWQRADDESFIDKKYSRAHTWSFDGGARIAASSSPHVVPVPYSVSANVDPEEAFVAAVSSCHMLWFLGLATERGVVVDRYQDQARAVMRKNATGQLAITDIFLRPQIAFGGADIPDAATIRELHDDAHARCFIANSIQATVHLELPASERN